MAWRIFTAAWLQPAPNEEPTHEVLWGAERLEQHALQLAREPESPGAAGRVDLRRHLRANMRQLEGA
jgi:hypothetical protein